MHPAQVVRRAADYLERHGVESPLPTAERLLAHVLETDRSGVYRRSGLSTEEAKRFGRALCRRCAGEPLQHVTGEQGFRRLVLRARPGVFVPRAETEVLVQSVLDRLRSVDAPVVVDVGTGSGAVALAVAEELAGATVHATDVSEEALRLARENAAALDLPVALWEGDLLTPLPEELRGTIDAVVSNPPYVPVERRDALPPDVRAEPEGAVFGDLSLYRRLFAQASEWLRAGGIVAVEIEESTADAVSEAAEAAGFEEPRVLPDLAGRDRVVVARRP